MQEVSIHSLQLRREKLLLCHFSGFHFRVSIHSLQLRREKFWRRRVCCLFMQVSIHSLQLRREKYSGKVNILIGRIGFNPLSSIKKREINDCNASYKCLLCFNPLSSIKKREIPANPFEWTYWMLFQSTLFN